MTLISATHNINTKLLLISKRKKGKWERACADFFEQVMIAITLKITINREKLPALIDITQISLLVTDSNFAFKLHRDSAF